MQQYDQASEDSTFPSDSAKSDAEESDSSLKDSKSLLFSNTPEIISQKTI
jgi:hypothetical protein